MDLSGHTGLVVLPWGLVRRVGALQNFFSAPLLAILPLGPHHTAEFGPRGNQFGQKYLVFML